MAVNQVNLANGEELINLTADTVSEDTLLEGETAHDASGNQITGKVVVTPVDSELNAESENAIQNKAVFAGINNAVNDVKEYANGIISNPNLLDNPDFSINQRGQTEYAGGGYCVDRWETTPTVSISGGKIVLNNKESGYSSFFQKIPLLSDLRGKTITASLLTEEVGSTVLTIKIPSTGVFMEDEAIGDLGSLRLGSVDSDSGLLLFDIRLNPTSALTPVHAKLELGSVATAFVPPNPATELAKCQRYLAPLDVYKRYTLSYFNTGMLNFLIPLNTAMRVTPSIVYRENGAFYVFTTKNIAAGAPALDLTDAVISIAGSASDGVILRVTKSAHNVTDGLAGVQGRVFLSADL